LKIQNLGAKVGDETRIALVPGCVPCLRPAAELAISRET